MKYDRLEKSIKEVENQLNYLCYDKSVLTKAGRLWELIGEFERAFLQLKAENNS